MMLFKTTRERQSTIYGLMIGFPTELIIYTDYILECKKEKVRERCSTRLVVLYEKIF